MTITVASGKGGAGKTSVAVSLALAAGQAVYVDCDVEEPNGALLLHPHLEWEEEATLPLPLVDEEKCDYCKTCSQACQFHAIMVLPHKVVVFDRLCHGCGTCSYVCPQKAISETTRSIGLIQGGRREDIVYLAGRLNIGEPMAPPLIRQVKARIPREAPLVVIDAPAGVACPFVETLRGSDFCLVVAESTPFGFHDYLLVEELLLDLDLPFGVVENKAGLGDDRLRRHLFEREISLLFTLPYNGDWARAYSLGVPLVEVEPSLSEGFLELLATLETAHERRGS